MRCACAGLLTAPPSSVPSPEPMRTENRTVLVVDSMGLAAGRQTRAETARLAAVHDALVVPVLRAFRGRRVGTFAGASLVLFEGATDALLCATAIQDRLWEYGRRVPEAERLGARVALAMGEVRIGRSDSGGEVLGEAVNLAARILGEAEAGEVWLSEALWWVVDRTRVPIEEMPPRPLKGFPESARLFRVVRATDGTPYGGAGLALVGGLAPADPAELARRASEGLPARPGRRAAIAALALVALVAVAGAASAVLRRAPSPPTAEALVGAGRLDAAEDRIRALEGQRGTQDPDVLYLHGLVDRARAAGGADARLPLAFETWSRAVARGSVAALAALRREGASDACDLRLLAARALVDAHAPAALPALREIAEADPPAGPPAGALARVLRALGDRTGCASGDVARAGILALERGR